mgnify:CR=1 FL=1
MKPLAVVACLDGRPGHEKQTQGVVAALTRLTAVAATEVKLPDPSITTHLKNWLVYLGTLGLRALRPLDRGRIDLIIGTGTATHQVVLVGVAFVSIPLDTDSAVGLVKDLAANSIDDDRMALDRKPFIERVEISLLGPK